MQEVSVKRKNYNAVDAVKFICAILVVAIHIRPFGANDASVFKLLNFGLQQFCARLAVPFFFIASGFFLFSKTDYDRFSAEPSKKYIKRLLKLYIIWTLIYLPLRIIDMLHDEHGIGYGILLYGRDIIFKGSYTQLWYLPALIFAAALVTFLIARKVSIRKIMTAAAVFYAAGLLAQSWFGIITPLKSLAPSLWTALKMVQKVIDTTRNGLFEGFVFVAIGAAVAYKGTHITKKKAFIGLVVSLGLFLLELAFVTYFRLARGYDMYIFLVPAAYFLFVLSINIQLPDNKIYITLRHLSSLVFYIHLLIAFIIRKAFSIAGTDIESTRMLFALTVVFSILCSLLIIKLSGYERFKWLRTIY